MWDEEATGDVAVVTRDSIGCEEEDPADLDSTPDSHYQVEKIVNRRDTPDGVQYRVKWKGFNAKYNQWKYTKDLKCQGLIDDYEMEQKQSENQPKERKNKSIYKPSKRRRTKH